MNFRMWGGPVSFVTSKWATRFLFRAVKKYQLVKLGQTKCLKLLTRKIDRTDINLLAGTYSTKGIINFYVNLFAFLNQFDKSVATERNF
jgi:hypothetical protein